MQTLQLLVDIALPAMCGGKTTDIEAIQKNILNIQQVQQQKIYVPGDIRDREALVITSIYNYICIIDIRTTELTGYMSFIDAHREPRDAWNLFRLMCPVKLSDHLEAEEKFWGVYNALWAVYDHRQAPVSFVKRNKTGEEQLPHKEVSLKGDTVF